MSKKVVCVLFGGNSSEHEVSLVSAANVVENIDKSLFEVVTVGITKEGRWYLYIGPAKDIKSGEWEKANNKSCLISPDTKHHGLLVLNKNGDVSVTKIDVIFPVLHGKNGEDGTVQGLFSLAGIPYVGNGVLSSAICMDKAVTKALLKAEGIAVTEGINIYDFKTEDFDYVKSETETKLGFPVVVKPSNAGSSVGVTLVKSEEELLEALLLATREDRVVLIERAVDAREIECAVLGDYKNIRTSIPGEIVKSVPVYDYNTKYVDDTAKAVIPADIDQERAEAVRQAATRIFRVLGGFGLARVDFFIDKQSGALLLNEVNTLPGFTSISLYPKAWEKTGLSYSDLLTELIELALKRE